MNQENRPDQAAALRRRAEDVSRENAARLPAKTEALSPEAAQSLLHDLRVHQIELEMQNEELRRSQVELEAARARYFDLYDLAPVGYCTLSKAGLILEANLTAATLLGVARGALIKQPIFRFILKEDHDIYYGRRKPLFEDRSADSPSAGQSGAPQSCELRMVKSDGTVFWAHLETTVVQDATGAPECRVVLTDITERNRAEAYGEMGRELLQFLNEPGALRVSSQRVIAALKRRTGFDAVGMRLQDGDDFPYFAQEGFPEDFLLTENTLLARAADGGLCRGKDGSVCLDCTCGLVLSGKTDPANPLFTRGGSCWTNNSFPLLNLPPDQDPRHHPRNHCIRRGYASIALVPIRNKDAIIGLLQFNDRRKGCFSIDRVELPEGIATQIGTALMRKRAEDALCESEEKFAKCFQRSPVLLNISTVEDGVFLDVNDEFLTVSGFSREELIGQRSIELGWIASADRAKLLAVLREKGRVAGLELTLHGKGGRPIHGLINSEAFTFGGRSCMVSVMMDITARKRAEENLRLSEESLAVTLQSIADAVIATDAAGLITRMNRTAERLTGWPLAEALGRSLPDVFRIVNALTRAPAINPVQLVMERGEIVGLANHTALLARDGREYQISDSAAPIRSADSRFLGVVLVFGDVTEKYRVQQALATTTEILERTGAMAKVGGWELDLRTMQLFWSLETCRIHEIEPPVAPPLDQAINFYAPEDRPIIQAAVHAAIEPGTPYDLELRLITAKGRPTWVRAQCAPVTEDGKVTKLRGAFHDISERKLAEDAVRESGRILRDSQSVAHIGAYITDLRATDFAANSWQATPEIYKIFGIDETYPHTLAGWVGFIHPDSKAELFAYHQRVVDERGHFDHEYRIVRLNDGAERWVQGTGELEYDDHQYPVRMLGTIQDITERKLAEEALRESLREKEALLKEVHHRVKNNLQVISSLLRLQSGQVENPGTREVLQDMQNRIRSMALLHETLYRSGNLARVDLADYLQTVCTQLFRATARLGSGTIRLQFDLVPVSVDATQAVPCGLLVNELVSNCLKHAFPNGRSGEVRVILQPVGGGLEHRLTVADDGVGLPVDLDSAKLKSLGLQLVSDLCAQMGGRLDLGPGPGALFAVTFVPKQQSLQFSSNSE
jgi:PAS domain S-box-containing protein